MKILYQQLGLDPERVRAVVERLWQAPHAGRPALTAVVVGDFSCVQRGRWLLERCGRPALETLHRQLESRDLKLLLQLPLVVKESELAVTEELVAAWEACFDGFVTGDLGLLAWLDDRLRARAPAKRLIYTSNVVNPGFSEWLRERFDLWRIRPLMHKRTFVEEPVGHAKDVVVYGNMMLNCSTFCVHSGDLPTRCNLGCAEPRTLTMEGEGEQVQLLGRSLITERRLDLRPRLEHIADLQSVTLQDLNLDLDELAEVYESLALRRLAAQRP